MIYSLLLNMSPPGSSDSLNRFYGQYKRVHNVTNKDLPIYLLTEVITEIFTLNVRLAHF